MSSTTFTLDVEDVYFSLFEQHRIHEVLAAFEPYADFDRDVYETTIGEVYKLARDVVAPINAKGDQQGCRLDDNHNVITPEGYKAAWDEFKGGGWIAPRADPELGGAGMPTPIAALIQEAVSGASLAFMMYPGLTAAAARVIHGFGPERFRDKVAKKLFAGEWGGTMCLTESGAGSAVGDNRARATKTDVEGVFELEGEKIYITGGDSDLVDNICHLVLARTDDAPNGIKGLSLFLVPKYQFDEDTLELGERNGAHVLRLEHKMGINASATCVLGLGTHGTCKGYLVGEERNGIAVMFHMMNEARIGVGVQGLAAGAVAFQYARHYAKERIQGTSAKDIKNANAKRVAIVEHPDVRRMLMSQKVLVETMRSMCYRLALDFDVSEHSDDEAKREKLAGRVDLLVPIFKSICTDIGFDVAVTGVQIFGGYGYTNEYPVEQVVRDAKIQSIYEGTNGIQALDLLGRKMRIGGGKLFMDWMQDMQLQLKAAKEEGFEEQAAALDKGIQSLAACAMHLASTGQDNLDAALLQATPFLNCFGRIVLGMEALDQARVAKKLMADKGESAFLKGKQLNLDFFISTFLPQAIALSKTIRSGDTSALDEALFQ